MWPRAMQEDVARVDNVDPEVGCPFVACVKCVMFCVTLCKPRSKLRMRVGGLAM